MERVLTIPWQTGAGNILLTEDAAGGVTISSDAPSDVGQRTQSIRLYTTNTSGAQDETTLTVHQQEAEVATRIMTGDTVLGLHDLVPRLEEGTYYVILYLVGKGGNGGSAGNGWAFNHGGSGGAGANGNIVRLSGRISTADTLEVKWNDGQPSLLLNGQTVAQAFAGGNGGNGGNAGAFSSGDGGAGGTAPAPTLPANGWNILTVYRDSQAPSGTDGGAAQGDTTGVQPNPLPGTKYDAYAAAGAGSTGANSTTATGTGCAVVEVYYKADDLDITVLIDNAGRILRDNNGLTLIT